MPAAGEVSVPLSPGQCAASARWLSGRRARAQLLAPIFAKYDLTSLLTTAGEVKDRSARAEGHAAWLEAFFAKRSTSNRRETAKRVMPREAAAWFGSQMDASLPPWPIPKLVREAMQACRVAAVPGRAGAPRKPPRRLHVIEREREGDRKARSEWIALGIGADEDYRDRRRNQRREAQAARAHEAWSDWKERMEASGKGPLGYDEPLPAEKAPTRRRKKVTD